MRKITIPLLFILFLLPTRFLIADTNNEDEEKVYSTVYNEEEEENFDNEYVHDEAYIQLKQHELIDSLSNV